MSTEFVRASVNDALAAREPIRISGAGGWMKAGRPVTAPRSVSLAGDTGIVDYVPDDLTITVRAGTTLEQIRAATQENGQWLPLDPPGGNQATIGATIATASSGPLSHGFGLVRDLILGLEFVTGKGDIVRSGGRVVKNVAGFDMMRLMCGAWGTLGVMTEVSLRLYALPKVDRTFVVDVAEGEAQLRDFINAIQRAPLSAYSLELLGPLLASRLGFPHRTVMLTRLAGNAALVDAQIKTLSEIANHTEADAVAWTSLSNACSHAQGYSVKVSSLPANVAGMWDIWNQIARLDESAVFHSTFSRGITRIAGSAEKVASIPRTDANRRVSYEVLPGDAWQTLSPSVVGDRLSMNVKRAFDPHFILNPGILG